MPAHATRLAEVVGGHGEIPVACRRPRRQLQIESASPAIGGIAPGQTLGLGHGSLSHCRQVTGLQARLESFEIGDERGR